MREAAIARIELEANLRQAVTRSELSLALQPIVRLSDAVPLAPKRWCDGSEPVSPSPRTN